MLRTSSGRGQRRGRWAAHPIYGGGVRRRDNADRDADQTRALIPESPSASTTQVPFVWQPTAGGSADDSAPQSGRLWSRRLSAWKPQPRMRHPGTQGRPSRDTYRWRRKRCWSCRGSRSMWSRGKRQDTKCGPRRHWQPRLNHARDNARASPTVCCRDPRQPS